MKYKYFLALSILILLGIGCSTEIKNRYTVKKIRYDNRALKSEITYINDSVKDGKCIEYYPSGEVMSIGYYLNNKQDSVYNEYYLDGKAKRIFMYYRNYPISLNYFYANGIMKHYNAKDILDDVFYVIKYDSLSNKLFEEGLIISPTVAGRKPTDGWKLNDTVFVVFFVSNPPGYNTNIFTCFYKLDNLNDTLNASENNKKIIQPYTLYKVNKSVVEFRTVLKEKGTFQIICAGERIDKATNSKTYDTVFRNIDVR